MTDMATTGPPAGRPAKSGDFPPEPTGRRQPGTPGHAGHAGQARVLGLPHLPTAAGDDDLDALATLAEPARRALYEYVAGQDGPVSRDQAADATGIKRPTAAFHLERLVGEGLLEAGYARLSGRTGPGAGRTAKLYTRARRRFSVSLPTRQYQFAGDILAEAIEKAQSASEPIGGALTDAARSAGQRLASAGGDFAEVLTRAGFEPHNAADGTILLANCPFHELAVRHKALICGLNLEMLRAMLNELRAAATAELNPAGSRCCVVIRPVPRRQG